MPNHIVMGIPWGVIKNMKYVVYCDESRHDQSPKNAFMSIGSLWLPRDKKQTLSKEFRRHCENLGLRGELKWSKVSKAYLDGYKSLIDFFFSHSDMNFRTIVVDQKKLDYTRFHGGDRELGFYKFYYELLVKWLQDGHEYLLLLDYQQNKDADRFMCLKRVLEHAVLGKAWISDLSIIDSRETPLAQLSDLLTGAASAAWCKDHSDDSPKGSLIRHIEKRRGQALTQPSPGPSISKYNVFEISLQANDNGSK